MLQDHQAAASPQQLDGVREEAGEAAMPFELLASLLLMYTTTLTAAAQQGSRFRTTPSRFNTVYSMAITA